MSDNGHALESGLITEVGAVAGAVVATEVAPPVAALIPGATGVGGDSQPTGGSRKVAPSIAGISALKGLILYGATLTFTGLYAYFIVEIFGAAPGTQPKFDAAMVSAAAALAGVLGSAFALEVGTPQEESKTNRDLAEALRVATKSTDRAKARIRQIFSLEGGSTTTASWPKTFGIWVYAIVATAVALTYVLNQTETPSTIKALAVAFGGYVVALINNAYHA
jgi:hypothetical protein